MTLHRDPTAPLGSIAFDQDPARWMEGSAAFTRPQQQRSRDALERIVASAVGLFSRSGFDAARVSDIASEAGVPVGTVYQHFPDKEALLAAIVAGYRACRMREIRELCTSAEARAASPRQLVELHLDIVFSAFSADAGLLRLIERKRLEDVSVHRDQSMANDVVATWIADLLVERLPDRDPAELRRQVHYAHSIIRGAVVWSVLPTVGELGEGLKVTDTGFAVEALKMALRYLGIDE
ncbi:TetR/AcrR family transcriptional regulator [Croceicoccus marinus]|nr:TetR/AcrR family transcriptional regulator [Croceicoccus marinus]